MYIYSHQEIPDFSVFSPCSHSMTIQSLSNKKWCFSPCAVICNKAVLSKFYNVSIVFSTPAINSNGQMMTHKFVGQPYVI